MAKPNKGGDASDVELNMTPMIDVVFNLLIFFMIVTDMTRKEIEELVLPWSEAAIEDQDDEKERRVIINIIPAPDWTPRNQNVIIKVKAEEYDLDQLKEELFKHAETKRDLEHPSQPSEIFVLIRCDKDIRWREVQWVMQACADPAVRIYKLQFATSTPPEENK
jgi:biopolymer transport protein ExbD